MLYFSKFAHVIINRTRLFSNPEAKLSLDFKYTPLPQVSLALPNEIRPKSSEGRPAGLMMSSLHHCYYYFCCYTVAGVLYVHVHSASGLRSADSDGLSDPYCLVLANKKKVHQDCWFAH